MINSFHDASKKVFKEYQEYFYSSFVQEEFERRFGKKKQMHLKKFYHDFKISLKNSNKELYSIEDLKKFAKTVIQISYWMMPEIQSIHFGRNMWESNLKSPLLK